jgi:hypothetical protein
MFLRDISRKDFRVADGRRSIAEAAVAGKDNRLRACPDAELVEKIGDVIAHRLFADCEPRRNLRVAEAFGEQREHFALTRAERGKTPGLPRISSL